MVLFLGGVEAIQHLYICDTTVYDSVFANESQLKRLRSKTLLRLVSGVR